jgi:hypothetical protein
LNTKSMLHRGHLNIQETPFVSCVIGMKRKPLTTYFLSARSPESAGQLFILTGMSQCNWMTARLASHLPFFTEAALIAA